ncbi:MAG: type II toxin-antitoxin system HicA family toxin [Verrucomicrobia bacterium]|nr:type II toxin-antitoxin system HicA family toxin [Verrucomicrobiota bacterium]
MKRRDLLRHLEAEGCFCARDTGPHSIWRNARTGEIQAVPRHVEIDYFLAKKICRRLSVPVPTSR